MPSGKASRRRRSSASEPKGKLGRLKRSSYSESPVAQREAPSAGSRLSISGTFRQSELVREARDHPVRVLFCQMGLFSMMTGAFGTVVALFVPEASVNNASNSVYVFGLVLILLIETVYQWMLRAGTLTGERGVIAIAEGNYPDVPVPALREYLSKTRESFEARLRRLFEPVEKVFLLSVALLIHLLAQESSGLPWARELSEGWVITLMLAFAGLLWQLKNPDNIAKLSSELRLERFLAGFGDRLFVFALPAMTIASIFVLGVAFFPWGFVSAAPLILAFWFTRKSFA